MVDDVKGPITRKDYELFMVPAGEDAFGRVAGHTGAPRADYPTAGAAAAAGAGAVAAGASQQAGAGSGSGAGKTRPLINQQVGAGRKDLKVLGARVQGVWCLWCWGAGGLWPRGGAHGGAQGGLLHSGDGSGGGRGRRRGGGGRGVTARGGGQRLRGWEDTAADQPAGGRLGRGNGQRRGQGVQGVWASKLRLVLFSGAGAVSARCSAADGGALLDLLDVFFGLSLLAVHRWR